MKRTLLTLAVTTLLATSAFADPIHDAADNGDLAGVQAELDKGAGVNATDVDGKTPLDKFKSRPELADLLRKHGGKTGEELKVEGK
jgi:ankyrin repeat protein